MRFPLAVLATAVLPLLAVAQQAPAPAPGFAPPNLTANGVRGMAANCAACHGTQGRAAPGASVRGLAGRPRDEIARLMNQYKSGQQPATVMHQIAKGYGEAEIAALADYFSRQDR